MATNKNAGGTSRAWGFLLRLVELLQGRADTVQHLSTSCRCHGRSWNASQNRKFRRVVPKVGLHMSQTTVKTLVRVHKILTRAVNITASISDIISIPLGTIGQSNNLSGVCWLSAIHILRKKNRAKRESLLQSTSTGIQTAEYFSGKRVLSSRHAWGLSLGMKYVCMNTGVWFFYNKIYFPI